MHKRAGASAPGKDAGRVGGPGCRYRAVRRVGLNGYMGLRQVTVQICLPGWDRVQEPVRGELSAWASRCAGRNRVLLLPLCVCGPGRGMPAWFRSLEPLRRIR